MASAAWIRHEYRNFDELTSNVYRVLYFVRGVSSSTYPVVRDQALAEFSRLLRTELAVYNRDAMEKALQALIDKLQELCALLDVRGKLLTRTGGGLPDHKTRRRWAVDGDITMPLHGEDIAVALL